MQISLICRLLCLPIQICMRATELLTLVVLGVFTVVQCYGQQRPMYGVTGNFNINFHNADFRAFPNVPNCCPRFEEGSGTGLTAGLTYDMPLTEVLRLSLRANYSDRSGTLSRIEDVVVSGNINGKFEHTVDANIVDIGIEPLLGYYVFDKFRINFGGRLGYNVIKQFSQKEVITEPLSGTFPNGRRSQNEVVDAPIPNANSINVGLLGGVSYNLKLNKKGTFYLSPEILYYQPFSGIVKDVDWTVSQLRFGASFFWSPRPYKEPIRREEEKFIIDTVERKVPSRFAGFVRGSQTVEKEIVENEDENDTEIITYVTIKRTDTNKVAMPERLYVSVKANAIHSDGKQTDNIEIRIEEFNSLFMTPFLNYVFFDENSSEIPNRYEKLKAEQTEQFAKDGVKSSDRLKTYYHLLNIVGKRMKENTGIKITLTGCNTDIGTEENNVEISKKRAESVKRYIVDTWGIDENRIKVEARKLPEKYANKNTEQGMQENRRVEITSNNSELLAPFVSYDTLRTSTPPTARFVTDVQHDNPIEEWNLQVEQQGEILKKYEGKGNVPKTMDWEILKDSKNPPRFNTPITYRLNVRDHLDKQVSDEKKIAVEQVTIRKKRIEKTADKEINRFGLILFDIRSTDINENNKAIIKIIKGMIQKNSTVKIIGYTDKTGDPATNKMLAEKRAKNTAKALGIPENSPNIEASGNSSTYNPEVPEGRLYTRTVDVIIETPVNE